MGTPKPSFPSHCSNYSEGFLKLNNQVIYYNKYLDFWKKLFQHRILILLYRKFTCIHLFFSISISPLNFPLFHPPVHTSMVPQIHLWFLHTCHVKPEEHLHLYFRVGLKTETKNLEICVSKIYSILKWITRILCSEIHQELRKEIDLPSLSSYNYVYMITKPTNKMKDRNKFDGAIKYLTQSVFPHFLFEGETNKFVVSVILSWLVLLSETSRSPLDVTVGVSVTKQSHQCIAEVCGSNCCKPVCSVSCENSKKYRLWSDEAASGTQNEHRKWLHKAPWAPFSLLTYRQQ